MKQPKVLIVSSIFPPEIGGPATYARALMDQRASGFTKVVSFGSPEQKIPGVSLVPTNGNFFTRQINLFYEVLRIGARSDLFLLLDPLTVGLTGSLAGKLLGKKTVLKFVGDPGWEKSMQVGKNLTSLDNYLGHIPKTDFSFLVTKLVLSLVDNIIVPSNSLKETIKSFYEINEKKITVIPNSVEIGPKLNIKKKNQLTFVGRLQQWKNIDQIVKAFEKVSQFFPNVKLLIIGDGPEEKSLRQLVQHLSLQKKVSFLGKLNHNQVMNVVSESKLLLLYSLYEGLPHVALEAMSVETLPILSRISGNNEVVGALFVDPNNPRLLAKTIVSVLKDELTLAKLSKQARINAEEKYGWAKNLNQLEKVFSSTVGE